MKQLSETPGEPAEVGATKIVFKLLNDASTACERLSKPDDEEALHDFRVSVRRLRTFLKSYQPYLATRPTRKAGKRLAGLMKRTNTGRDDQVHVQWLREQLARQRISKTERAGVEMMLREIEQKPEQINGDTINKIADHFRTIRDNLRMQFDPRLQTSRLNERSMIRDFASATGHLIRGENEKLTGRLAQIRSIHDQEAAHQARLAAKRVRYLIEPVRKQVPTGTETVRQLKGLQDLLGQMHDLDVLESTIGTVIEREALDWSQYVRNSATGRTNGTVIRQSSPQLDACHALAAALKRANLRQRTLFRALEKRWIGQTPQSFFARIDRIVRYLDPQSSQALAASPPSEVSQSIPSLSPTESTG